ncbi:hypothetical protein B0T26DRAFT_244851 [Lasiosphaeria miniovina]|uniref:Uncharacterized protein n=1 Tax=Lasiosphaeria miniovina TaxID=1954250 RepID=A0AA40E051_9PEZI|nr:uncharacterized protein B0T26DRAFT_244851 [Lasiosphaeria miniovina]KAK0723004.1 hypothetical protein B0T26DRAFT_244851 [Lasiosphaeria miniovina]
MNGGESGTREVTKDLRSGPTLAPPGGRQQPCPPSRSPYGAATARSSRQALGTVFLLWYLGVPVPGAPANPRYLRAPFSASTYTGLLLVRQPRVWLSLGSLDSRFARQRSGTQALWHSGSLVLAPPPSTPRPRLFLQMHHLTARVVDNRSRPIS